MVNLVLIGWVKTIQLDFFGPKIYGCFQKEGENPRNGRFYNGKPYIKWMIWGYHGVPLFLETSIYLSGRSFGNVVLMEQCPGYPLGNQHIHTYPTLGKEKIIEIIFKNTLWRGYMIVPRRVSLHARKGIRQPPLSPHGFPPWTQWSSSASHVSMLTKWSILNLWIHW